MKRIGSAALLLALTPSGDWHTRAACGPQDADDFFPEGPRAYIGAANTHAKQLCTDCPVVEECLQWAIDTRQAYGTWGGLTAAERRPLTAHTRRPRTGGRQLAKCGTPAAYERHRRNHEHIDPECMANRTRKKKEVAA